MVAKRVVEVVGAGCQSGGGCPPLSDAQKEVRVLYYQDNLTVRQIAQRRKTSVQAVTKVLRQLRELGANSPPETKVVFSGIGGQPRQPFATWELHGCAWRCPVHHGKDGERYRAAIGQGMARVTVRDCTVELHRDVVEVSCDVIFRADNPEAAVSQSWGYLWRVLDVVENDYRVILRKDRCPIRRFRGHFPHLDDALARTPCGAEIVVLAEDGKQRFIIDWSKKTFPEAEWLHSAHGQDDSRKYAAFLHDLVEKEHFPLSELSELMVRFQAEMVALTKRENQNNLEIREAMMAIVRAEQVTSGAVANIAQALKLQYPEPVKEDRSQVKMTEYVRPDYVG